MMRKRIALLVGCDAYNVCKDFGKLNHGEKDAKEFRDVLEELCGFKAFVSFNATLAHFDAVKQWMTDNLKPDCDFLFFFSGHGVYNGGTQYLVPIDGTTEIDSLQSLDELVQNAMVLIGGTAFAKREAADVTSASPAPGARLFVILDCCREYVPGSPKIVPEWIGEKPPVTEHCFLYACQKTGLAKEGPEHGFLTESILEELRDEGSIGQDITKISTNITKRCTEKNSDQLPKAVLSITHPFIFREGVARVTEGQNQESEEDRAERARKAQEKDMKLGYWMLWPHVATVLIDGHNVVWQARPGFMYLAMLWSFVMFLAETLFVVADRKLFCPVQNYGDYVFLVLDFLKFALACFAAISDARVHKDDFTKLTDVAFVARLIFFGLYVVLLFRKRVSKLIIRILLRLWSSAEQCRPLINQQPSSSSSPP